MAKLENDTIVAYLKTCEGGTATFPDIALNTGIPKAALPKMLLDHISSHIIERSDSMPTKTKSKRRGTSLGTRLYSLCEMKEKQISEQLQVLLPSSSTITSETHVKNLSHQQQNQGSGSPLARETSLAVKAGNASKRTRRMSKDANAKEPERALADEYSPVGASSPSWTQEPQQQDKDALWIKYMNSKIAKNCLKEKLIQEQLDLIQLKKKKLKLELQIK